MYEECIFDFGDSVEHEIKTKGKYGAKGEKRAKRKKASPEQMKRQNQWNREKKMRRLIKANFAEGDLWQTLKYPKGVRKSYAQVMKDLEKYRDRMRRIYKKKGQPYKWISRIEIGSRGGIHAHMITNRLNAPDADLIAQRTWEEITGGRINHATLYTEGGYEKLARYITKKPNDEQQRQLREYDKDEVKGMIKYSTSRNLVRPEPVVKRTHWRTIRKMVTEGIKPREGFYVLPESVYYGINPYNGMTYLKYTEYRLRQDGRSEPVVPTWRTWEDEGG